MEITLAMQHEKGIGVRKRILLQEQISLKMSKECVIISFPMCKTILSTTVKISFLKHG